MSWWTIAVYAVAALWAMRTLFALMIQHRRRLLDRLMAQENARQEAESQPAPEATDKPGVVSRPTAKAA